MIKNIIFDIGGVVVQKGKLNAVMKMFAKVVFGTTNPDFFKEERISKDIKEEWEKWRLGKITAKSFFNRQRKKFHLKLSTNKMAYLLYHSQKPNKKITHLIKKLNKKYKIYALTNHTKEWFSYQKKKYDYDLLFSGVMTSFQAKSAKPDSKIYKELIKRYKLKPQECLFIDDQKENLVTAKTLGMKTILYKDSQQLKKELIKNEIL
mgnify:CR=1 FL=1